MRTQAADNRDWLDVVGCLFSDPGGLTRRVGVPFLCDLYDVIMSAAVSLLARCSGGAGTEGVTAVALRIALSLLRVIAGAGDNEFLADRRPPSLKSGGEEPLAGDVTPEELLRKDGKSMLGLGSAWKLESV